MGKHHCAECNPLGVATEFSAEFFACARRIVEAEVAPHCAALAAAYPRLALPPPPPLVLSAADLEEGRRQIALAGALKVLALRLASN
jgi:hypothetical protein